MRTDYTLPALLVFTAVLASACAGGPAGSSARNACPPAIEKPALYAGETWRYREENGRYWSRTYSSMTEDGFLKGRGAKADADYYYDQTHTVRKVFRNGTWLTSGAFDFPEIGNPEIEFPLTVGKNWTIKQYSDARVLINQGYSVVGCEEVTVPAGTFFAVRIEVTRMYTHTPAAAYQEYTLWYAPAVKFWVKRTGGRAAFWPPVMGYELVSFTVDGRKPATPLAALSSLGQQDAPSPGPTFALAPIWERGYEWKFRWSSPRGSGTFVQEVARDELTSDVPQYVVKTGTRETHHRKTDLAWVMDRADGAVETRATPASMWFTWPLAVGKVWEQTYAWENPGQRITEERTRRYKVEAVETVIVPAGTFQTFHVTATDQTGRFIREYWYSPDVMWWVKERGAYSYGVREQELLEYKLRATGAPAP